MTQSKSLILKNNEKELIRLVEFVEAFADECNLDPQTTMNINLALEEAIVNVMKYAFFDNLDHDIILRMHHHENTILMEVEDDGDPFNPLEQDEPDRNLSIEERPVGGLGIFLIKTLMTEVKYKRCEGKNILQLKKIL